MSGSKRRDGMRHGKTRTVTVGDGIGKLREAELLGKMWITLEESCDFGEITQGSIVRHIFSGRLQV